MSAIAGGSVELQPRLNRSFVNYKDGTERQMRNKAQTFYFYDQHQKVWEKNINLSQERRM